METVKELRVLARRENIAGRSSMNKAELLRAIKRSLKQSPKRNTKKRSTARSKPKGRRSVTYSPRRGGYAPHFNFSGSDTWLIYTKDGCGPCSNAKKLLTEKNIQFTHKRHEDSPEYRSLAGSLNYHTFPMILHNGKPVKDGSSGLGAYLKSIDM